MLPSFGQDILLTVILLRLLPLLTPPPSTRPPPLTLPRLRRPLLLPPRRLSLYVAFFDPLYSPHSPQFKAEAAPAEAKKEDRPKSPSILAKLLAPFKGDKKEKAEKKPKEKAVKKTEKKEEKKEEVSRRSPMRSRRLASVSYVFIGCRCSRGRGGSQGARHRDAC